MAAFIEQRNQQQKEGLKKLSEDFFGEVCTPRWIWIVNGLSIGGMLLGYALTFVVTSEAALLYILLGCWLVVLIPFAGVACGLTLIRDRKRRSLRETLVLVNLLIINIAPILLLVLSIYLEVSRHSRI